MKKEKMSLEKMNGVLSHVLTRDEMKEVLAGSGGGGACGMCHDYQSGNNYYCYMSAGAGGCWCGVYSMYCY